MEVTQSEAGENSKDIEVAPALVTVHPSHHSVAVAVGSDLRVFDLRGDCGISLTDESAEPFHKDSIRAIRYSKSGKLLVSAGDDKLVKIWCTNSWRCISSVSSEKRVSAVAVSNDELYVCFSDKFGVVWVVDLHELDGQKPLLNKKPAPLLAHYCSIITSLEFSPDGQFILSADRDFKIRVTVFPKKPLEGAHEIQSFCLGHTEFVSCLAFVCTVDYPQGLLVSGSGDSTVRLWDITSGSLLDTCEVGAGAVLTESTGNDEACFSVTDLCTIAGSNLVAVAIQSLQGIMLLKCDLALKTLNIIKVVPTKGETFIPTSLGSSSSEELLWMVTGVSKLQGSDYNSLARVRVISSIEKGNINSSDPQLTVLGDDEIPGAEKLLEKLQGNVSIEEKVFLAAADAVKTAMCKLLIKKHYPSEKRDFRKRTRNDRKSKK